jgi:hypothetical protein
VFEGLDGAPEGSGVAPVCTGGLVLVRLLGIDIAGSVSSRVEGEPGLDPGFDPGFDPELASPGLESSSFCS